MPRTLREIIGHIRAVSANPSISTTLIQTEDLELLCNEAEEHSRKQQSLETMAGEVAERNQQIARLTADNERLRAALKRKAPVSEVGSGNVTPIKRS